MKKRKRTFTVMTTACCATVFLLGSTSFVQATGDSQFSTSAVAGITRSLENHYKDTSTKQNIKNKEKKSKGTLANASIGIADVKNYLNIREKANDESAIIGMLPKNGGCYIYNIDKNGWAKIKSGDITGYVLSDYLITGNDMMELAQKVGAKIGKVTVTTARIREKQTADATTIALVPKGEELEVLEDSNPEWVYVRIDSDKGYVSKDCVEVRYQLAKANPVEEAVSASTSATSSLRAQMVSYAKKFLGGKYVYGGTSLKTGIDCSAFMMRIYQHFGYNISRTSRSQAQEGKEIELKNVKPGDLVFYEKKGTINHVAMYIGGGKIIHASNRVSGIKISKMYYKVPCKAVRMLEEE